jgi:hypothetical protein
LDDLQDDVAAEVTEEKTEVDELDGDGKKGRAVGQRVAESGEEQGIVVLDGGGDRVDPDGSSK